MSEFMSNTSNKKIIILGATGGCLDILNILVDYNSAASTKYPLEPYAFLDDKQELWDKQICGVKVIGGFHKAKDFINDCFFVTGIGSSLNYFKRLDILENLNIPREKYISVIHPTASVSSFASLGVGVVLHQHVTVSTNSILQDHVLILANSVVNHDCKISEGSIITSGVCLSGAVTLGRCCYIGSNSSIRQDVVVGDYSLVGMQSLVLENVPAKTVVFGSPARLYQNIDYIEKK